MKTFFAVLVVVLFSVTMTAQTSAPSSTLQIGQWRTWQSLPVGGNAQPQAFGIWVPVYVGNPAAKILTTTITYADGSGRPLIQTISGAISTAPALPNWQNQLFTVGKVQPTAIVATTGIVGSVSDVLTATDPNARGAIFYDDDTNMAVAGVQATWAYPSGTGVLVTTTFKQTDTDSIGVLLVVIYKDGTSDTHFVPRGTTPTFVQTSPDKTVERPDLYRVVIGESVAVSFPSASTSSTGTVGEVPRRSNVGGNSQ